MRPAGWLLVLMLGCEHGLSVAPDNCNHTQPDSACCVDDRGCATGTARFCVPPDVVQDACETCDGTPSTCADDFECQAMNALMICEERPCACVGQRACTLGCELSTECAEGEECDLRHRCTQKLCANDSGCPSDFFCAGSSCFRRGCTTNEECDAFCVEGRCFQVAGECQAPSG